MTNKVDYFLAEKNKQLTILEINYIFSFGDYNCQTRLDLSEILSVMSVSFTNPLFTIEVHTN